MPEDWEEKDIKTMDYQGYAYYGEYPLAFAACFENKDIYDLLIQYGANPDLQDMFGNTVAMYSYAVRHWHKPAHTNIVNHASYTPLTLATKLGRRQIFDEMLELMKVEFWRFSDMTCSAYPLDALDTVRPDGSTNYDSALFTVINGNTPDHLEMIGSEVIQRLLADKWKAFAERKLFQRLALLIFHLVCICFVVYLRPADEDRLYLIKPIWPDWLRTVFELLTIISCLWFVLGQQLSELRTQGIYDYLRNLMNAPSKIVYLFANLCLIACAVLRFLRMPLMEEALLAFALPGSWIFLLFFARSAKLTGPFVQMIYSMIAGDMLLADDDPYFCSADHKVTNYASALDTFMTLFRICMNGMDYEEFGCSNYEPLTKTLFVLMMFIMPIMMTNILIAMMGTTYTNIISQAEMAWRQQYAQIVMVLERSVDKRTLATVQLDYSIRMNDPGRETRGLMVIRQTKKTRAKQRKQAIANWKSIGRKIITMAKELGLESTSYLLHSHDRLVTDETVGGGQNPRGSFGIRPPTSIAGNSSPNSYRPGGRKIFTRGVDGGVDDVGDMEEMNKANTGNDNTHGNFQYYRLGDRQMSPALRSVVTHAAINNAKLMQMNTQKQLTLAGHRKLANGNILPGVADAARRLLVSAKGTSEERIISSFTEIQLPVYTNIKNNQQHVHLTQRKLAPSVGSRVRGVEMLPSIDVPNIPATETKTDFNYPPPLYEENEEDQTNNNTIFQMDEGRLVTNSEPSSDTENERQNRYKKRLSTENISSNSINDRAKAANLFRKKDSPQEAKGKRQKMIKVSKSVSVSASSSATSSNDSRVINKKNENKLNKNEKKS
uniref:ANK_REP_REGION domain-containing protein n=1 Tax=Meloidogyne hapla TaxID=6305 RepID=A0A1I8BZ20_MELHA